MQIYKRVSYVQVAQGWQTYVYPVNGGFIRYKLLTSTEALADAIAQCQKSGWIVNNATTLVRQLNAKTQCVKA
jgi:hypothetical protein